MLDNEGKRFLDDISIEDFKAQIPGHVEFVRNAQEVIDATRTLAGVGPVGRERRVVRVQSRL